MPAVASLALIAPSSASYSTKAMPLRPGTVRTSLKPAKREKMATCSTCCLRSALSSGFWLGSTWCWSFEVLGCFSCFEGLLALSLR
ncbi:hypothetical protein KCU83_g308, partial [Aureobasidium melanogenum]